jgi:hypothetical protein
MSDYNLSGLSTRSFEQLIQTLAAKVLGPGLVVFGDGPDGGREAVFEGRVPYPSDVDQWEGYIVIQAKFKQKSEGTASDGKWAILQLRKELHKFRSDQRRLRRPDYYLYCTNVVLSPVHKKGSKDKINAIFGDHRRNLPLKGFDVWDYDKLRVFLDQFEDIRRTYAAWITSGDVLASVVSHLEKLRPDFEKDISTFLQKELLSDQYVNLDQAGHSSEEQIPMGRVFVDLVATEQPTAEPPKDESENGASLKSGFVRDVLLAGEARLSTDNGKTPAFPISKAFQGRFVLIGGPGQGKSTSAQYLCQLYRVAMLTNSRKGLAAECRPVLDLIQKHSVKEGLQVPSARRFPIRVVLSDLAKTLASGKAEAPKSLFTYIARRIRILTNSQFSPDDLKRWLASYPWFLVLDGLDEVPPSSNRNDVLAAIQDFWVDAASCGADILVLATTRPQGYNRDFSPEFYSHRYLAPLSVERALYYARRLVGARFGLDTDRGRRVSERLKNASNVEATARLMTSPLQVTIMATLVDRAGQPPPERWRLFSEYYDVIYKREMERDNPAAAVLRAHKTHIDGIHHWAGLELQIESERTGTTDARLSRAKFSDLVSARLRSEGYAGAPLTDLCSSITEAATLRLVFLVGVEADKVGFEIRSLQEFMAAEAIMDGGDVEVAERLKAIAPITYWRNVFLFAAGKCFTVRPHLRDIVASVCENLNEELGVEKAALAGSEVALDLLRDGTARQHPKFQLRLARNACRLTDRPPGAIHTTLAATHYDLVDEVFREELSRRLSGEADGGEGGALLTATLLALKGAGWAIEIVDRNWPRNRELQSQILVRLGEIRPSRWIKEKLTSFFQSGLMEPSQRATLLKLAPEPWAAALGIFVHRNQILTSAPLRLRNLPTSPFPFAYRYVTCRNRELLSALLTLPARNEGWQFLREVGRFASNPNKAALAECLRRYGQAKIDWFGYFPSPWPVAMCLDAIESPEEADAMAQRASNGDFGDIGDWSAAENRWRDGITVDDIRAFDEHDGSIGTYMREVGFPVPGAASFAGYEHLAELFYEFVNLRESLRSPQVRSRIASNILFVASFMAETQRRPLEVHPQTATELYQSVSALKRRHVNLVALATFSEGQEAQAEWIEAFDQIGKLERINMWPGSLGRFSAVAAAVHRAFLLNPHRRGLARILAATALEPLSGPAKLDLTIPDAILASLKWEDSPYREALIQLRLIQPDLSPEGAARLANEITQSEGSSALADLCVDLALRRSNAAALEGFVLQLYSLFPPSAWGVRGAISGALDDLLRRRRSGLYDSDVRVALKLPVVC